MLYLLSDFRQNVGAYVSTLQFSLPCLQRQDNCSFPSSPASSRAQLFAVVVDLRVVILYKQKTTGLELQIFTDTGVIKEW